MQRSSLYAFLLILFFLYPIILNTNIVAPKTNSTTGTVIYPIADTYVEADSPNSNYGGQTTLRVNSWQPSSDFRDFSYFLFDLTSIPCINQASFHVRAGSSETTTVGVVQVEDTSWQELNMTWNNRPSIGKTIAQSLVITFGQWLSFDVTNTAISKRGSFFSLGMISLAPSSELQSAIISSREDGQSYSPYLNITTTPVDGCIPISSPKTKTYKENSVWLTYSIVDNVTWVGYKLDNNPEVTIDNNGSVLLANLTDGDHHVTVIASGYGNASSSATIFFTIDVYPETITLTETAISIRTRDVTKTVVSGTEIITETVELELSLVIYGIMLGYLFRKIHKKRNL